MRKGWGALSSATVLAMLCLVAACSSAEGDVDASKGALGKACVPNQTFKCLCGLDDGTQECTPKGELTPCVCGAKPGESRPDDTTPTPAPSPPSACGNGVVDPGEACDDGNVVSEDGCSASCVPDAAPASADMCPGQPVTVWKGSKVVLSGTTQGMGSQYQVLCAEAPGPDRIYAITPQADGVLSIDASFASGYDAVVSVRKETCTALFQEVLCEDTFGEPVKRVVQVKKGVPVFLILDSARTTSAGVYSVTLELP